MDATFETVTSADGTLIAFEREGDGPPVLVVGGAFNNRSTADPPRRQSGPRFDGRHRGCGRPRPGSGPGRTARPRAGVWPGVRHAPRQGWGGGW
jgi:hypothetical protein